MSLLQIEKAWQSLFSKPLSLHTCPTDLKDGELTINVDSPIWLQQLKFLQPMILQKLNEYPVKSIRLKLGKVKRKSNANVPSNKLKSATLSKADREWLNRLLSGISDAEIKESIKKAFQNLLKYNKYGIRKRNY